MLPDRVHAERHVFELFVGDTLDKGIDPPCGFCCEDEAEDSGGEDVCVHPN